MLFVWDETKRQENKRKHGFDFADAVSFEFDTAFENEDVAAQYNETRIKAIGILGDVICVLVYTMRDTDMRVISLRRAIRREIESYVHYQEQ